MELYKKVCMPPLLGEWGLSNSLPEASEHLSQRKEALLLLNAGFMRLSVEEHNTLQQIRFYYTKDVLDKKHLQIQKN